jgi:signal transduction histidine kinase
MLCATAIAHAHGGTVTASNRPAGRALVVVSFPAGADHPGASTPSAIPVGAQIHETHI